jgi:hypothetical protein
MLSQVRDDRAAAIEPQLVRLEAADRETLADAIAVLRRLLGDSAPGPATRRTSIGAGGGRLASADVPTTYNAGEPSA